MRKIPMFPLISCLTGLAVVGCSVEQKPDEYQSSILEDLPFVYKMTVQQGNIITEEMVDSLKPGMTKNQVSFVLGTPLLTDFFHTNRWDYTYTIQRAHQRMEKRNLTLFFQDEALTRIEGGMRPDAKRGESRVKPEMVVSVPDYKEKKGFFSRGLEAVGLEQEPEQDTKR
jgi:outer membrane protein assembly factor BamE